MWSAKCAKNNFYYKNQINNVFQAWGIKKVLFFTSRDENLLDSVFKNEKYHFSSEEIENYFLFLKKKKKLINIFYLKVTIRS